MIDSRFGLKYSFPHTLVHIVDNSAYTGPLGVTETYDPSLLTTLVVTGMPMGVDNRITTVTRSDVLNKAFGAEALTEADIKKYGQTVEYPTSLINQGVPVKLLRITPPDAAYGVSVIYYEWRVTNDGDAQALEARFRQATLDDLTIAGINLSAYKNTERLANALFMRLKNDNIVDDGTATDTKWHRVVLFAYISAGKGEAYNNFSIYINRPTLVQEKKFANAIYNFGTIDNRYSTAVEIERFTASLINESTKLSTYGGVSMMDTVNVQMKKRLEGSSIMVPYVNEEAIKEIHKKWKEIFENNKSSNVKSYRDYQGSYTYIYNVLKDVNKFDIIFGRFLYDKDNLDREVNIPYYKMNMATSEIRQLDLENIIVEDNYSVNGYNGTEATIRGGSLPDTKIHESTGNDVNNAIFRNKIYPYWNTLYGRSQTKTTSEAATDSEAVHFWDGELLNPQSIEDAVSFEYEDDKDRDKDLKNLRSTVGVAPGTLYLTNPDSKEPTISMIYSIQQYTGTTMVVNIPKLYNFFIKETENAEDNTKYDYEYIFDKTSVGKIAKVFTYKPATTLVNDAELTVDAVKNYLNSISSSNIFSKFTGDNKEAVTAQGDPSHQIGIKAYGSIIALSYTESYSSNIKKFKLYRIGKIVDGKIDELIEYPKNYYAALAWESYYSGATIHELIALKSKVTIDPADYPEAYNKLGALYIDDETTGVAKIEGVEKDSWTNTEYWAPMQITGSGESPSTSIDIKPNNTVQLIAYFQTDGNGETTPVFYDVSGVNPYRVGNVPSVIQNITDFSNREFDYLYLANNIVSNQYGSRPGNQIEGLDMIGDADLINYIGEVPSADQLIIRYQVTSFPMSTIKLANENLSIPNNYYMKEFGDSPESEYGGFDVIGGSSGFFDDAEMSSIEFKLKYSELLVQAFKGEIDPRILSPARVPAKYLFDGGFNTVLGIKSLPFADPTIEDYVYASTIFTEDEKEEYAINSKLISAGTTFNDIDVKQAMYDLMIHRCYQGIPDDKRPIGPGSGLSLHLDSGFGDIEVIKKLNESFKTRFTNPNASWDIGGYTSAANGMTYTYVKRLVDHMFEHMQKYTVNKPFVNTYSEITVDEYTSFFPDIDTTDWDLEELLYTSGGNSWVLDESRSLKRKSQRTLYREETGTSDLLQESNMRTLSQLIYLLQNKIDKWLLEYTDDGVLTSMTETINNIFSGWIGTRVQNLEISFEKDINTDGGEIVVCYVNVTFRGLLLRVPIIVNVNRRVS